MAFQGFSKETFEFFMAIRFNNNRDFFQDNRDWYLRAVRQPCYALAEALTPPLREIDPGFDYRPYRIVSRINRDIRFSNDKSPYRDHMWLSFRPAGEEGKRMPGFYMEISDESACFGMGFYRENRGIMKGIRRSILHSPDEISGIMTALGGQGYALYTVPAARITLPDGVRSELTSLYTARSFYLEKIIDDCAVICSPRLAEEIGMGYRELFPLYRYILAAGSESAPEAQDRKGFI